MPLLPMPLIDLTGHIDGCPERPDSVAAGRPAQIPMTRAEPGGLDVDVTPGPPVASRWLVVDPSDSRQAVEADEARSDAGARAKASAGVPPCIRVAEVDG
jgi:hypothetical protein